MALQYLFELELIGIDLPHFWRLGTETQKVKPKEWKKQSSLSKKSFFLATGKRQFSLDFLAVLNDQNGSIFWGFYGFISKA